MTLDREEVGMRSFVYGALGALAVAGTLVLGALYGGVTDGITTTNGRYAFVPASPASASGNGLASYPHLWRIDRQDGKVECLTVVPGQPWRILITRER